ncbi:MFS transporter [Candidatus Bathyarchaeota archaeon]|nr:MFS transporter [Candidatus Bathyarchaeota archaeon]
MPPSWASTRSSSSRPTSSPISPPSSSWPCSASKSPTVRPSPRHLLPHWSERQCTEKGETKDNANLPPVYFLQKFPAAKWLGANVVLWGVATACGAAAKDYPTLLVSRVFLGIFEATIAPSLMLISSQWYTKSEAAPRFSFWYLGLGLGQILGGIVSYAFQHIAKDAALSGWRVMFIVLGCLTVLIGLWTFFLLPDTPMKASWLSDREKVILLKHVSINQTGIQNRKFRWKEIGEALIDPQIYLLLISVILVRLALPEY